MNPDIFVDPSSVGMWTVSTYTKNKMKMNRKENLICRFDVPRAFELLKDRLLSICTFHELPSSTILRPKCLLHEICWVNSHPLGKEAFTHCLFVGQFNLTWLSSVFICSAFFHGPLLCCVFSIFLCSRLERGSTRTNSKSKRLFVPRRQKTHLHSFLPLSVYLLHTPSMSMSLSPVFSFQQCFISVPQPTHQNTTTGRHELLPLASVSLLFSLSVTSSSTQSVSLSQSPSFSPSMSQIGDLTQHPHYCDFIRQQLQSRPQSKVLVEGTINTNAVSGTSEWDYWEGNFWKISTTSICHVGHLIFLKSESEFHMSLLSAERMPTCLVWEIEVVGSLNKTTNVQVGQGLFVRIKLWALHGGLYEKICDVAHRICLARCQTERWGKTNVWVEKLIKSWSPWHETWELRERAIPFPQFKKLLCQILSVSLNLAKGLQ